MEILVTGLENLIDGLASAQNISENMRARMEAQGDAVLRQVKRLAGERTVKRSGNYLDGIRRGQVYKYEPEKSYAVRVYAGAPAHHAHLLEYGHAVWPYKERRTRALHVFEDARLAEKDRTEDALIRALSFDLEEVFRV